MRFPVTLLFWTALSAIALNADANLHSIAGVGCSAADFPGRITVGKSLPNKQWRGLPPFAQPC